MPIDLLIRVLIYLLTRWLVGQTKQTSSNDFGIPDHLKSTSQPLEILLYSKLYSYLVWLSGAELDLRNVFQQEKQEGVTHKAKAEAA